MTYEQALERCAWIKNLIPQSWSAAVFSDTPIQHAVQLWKKNVFTVIVRTEDLPVEELLSCLATLEIELAGVSEPYFPELSKGE